MHALTQYYDLGELAIRAVEAGADMVLTAGTATDRRRVFDQLRKAYRDGRLRDARVRQSLRRILSTKLHRLGAPSAQWDRAASHLLIRDIATSSITIVGQTDGALARAATAIRDRNAFCVGSDSFCKRLQVRHCTLSVRISSKRSEERACVTKSAGSLLIIGAMQNRSQAAIVAQIHDRRPDARLVAISLGNPHDLELVPRADAYIAAYGTAPAIELAVTKVLAGTLFAHGSLPVRLAVGKPQSVSTSRN